MRRLFFDLCYQQHGGSGLNVTLNEVQRMPMGDILEYTRMLDERRTAEAKAIQNARK